MKAASVAAMGRSRDTRSVSIVNQRLKIDNTCAPDQHLIRIDSDHHFEGVTRGCHHRANEQFFYFRKPCNVRFVGAISHVILASGFMS